MLLTSNLINYGARLGYYIWMYHWQAKCQTLNLFVILSFVQHYYDSRLLHHQITLLWGIIIVSDIQTGIGAPTHAPLDTEQLISHNRAAIVDTIASLQGMNGRVLPVSEIYEFLFKIYVILDNALSKYVGNTTCILAHLLYSTSKLHCEVWALYFPLLHNFIDTVSPSEACLYGGTNWSLA